MGYFERELSKRFKKVTFIFLSNRMSSVYVTRMYLYSIHMSLVCTRVSFLYHSYVIVCYPYVTRMYSYVIYVTHMHSYVIRMSLVCGFTMNLIYVQIFLKMLIF